MRTRFTCLLLAGLVGFLGWPMPPARAVAPLELYGTYHAMGITVSQDPADDPELDATAAIAYRPAGGGAYRAGFPLTRVSDTRFAGSLLWLKPGRAYEVRVTFSDAGGPLDGAAVEGTASTRAEIIVTAPAPGNSWYVHRICRLF